MATMMGNADLTTDNDTSFPTDIHGVDFASVAGPSF